jgi:hypothetical protein
VVPVAHHVPLADAVDRDRRHRRAARLRDPQPLPVLGRRAAGAELGVERPRLALLDGAGDRVERDRPDAEHPSRRGPRPARAIVDHLEALGRQAAQPAPQARAASLSQQLGEAGLGLRPGRPGQRDRRVEDQEQRGDRQQPAGRAADRDGRGQQRGHGHEPPSAGQAGGESARPG